MMKLETITRTMVGLGIAAVCATAQTARAQPCSGPDACGPGEYWIDGCGAGTDEIPSSRAEVGIYLADDCTGTPINFVLFGPATVERQEETGGTINTEITYMSLKGGGATLIVGAGLGQGGDLQASPGKIIQTGDPRIGFSSFDVFFEFYDARTGYVYNQDPMVVQADITCVPPQAEYIHPEGQCIALYNADDVLVAHLGDAVHQTFRVIPTLSEWAAIAMTLLLLTGGTIVFFRKRAREAATA